MLTHTYRPAPLPSNDAVPDAFDIVYHLGRTRRFGGFHDREWTVLHHTALVTMLWMKAYGPKDVHHIFCHDLHEYITGDVPSPVKAELRGFDEMAKNLDERIYRALGAGSLPQDPVLIERIKVVDLAALLIEANYIVGSPLVQHICEVNVSQWARPRRFEVFCVVSSYSPEMANAFKLLGYFPKGEEPA